jgi:salicylate hydroxylase
MLPFLAQGAAMAIEDGAVLASSLSSFSDCKLGLIDYESKRKIRTTMVQKMAARNAKIFHLSGLSAVMRNLFMNFAGKKIMSDLYNYDATDI